MKFKSALLAACVLASSAFAVTPAGAAILSIAGDQDCFGLGGSCPDGTLWRDGLGGTFFTSNAGPGDPAGTDDWNAFVGPTYALTFGGGSDLSIEIKTAGIADNRGPWDVLLNGAFIGQITTNSATNAFQEVRTFSYLVTAGQLSANNLITIDTGNNDGFSIDYVALVGTAVPEPATWAMMIAGFGLAGAAMRRRERLAIA